MAKHRMSRRGPRGAVAVMIVSGVAAACSAIPNEPAPVFMKGGAPGVAATGPGPALVSRPLGTAGAQPGAAMPRETRPIPAQRAPAPVAALPPPTSPSPPPQPAPAPVAAPMPQSAPQLAAPAKSIAFPPREPSAAEEARTEAAAATAPAQNRGGHFPWPLRGR